MSETPARAVDSPKRSTYLTCPKCHYTSGDNWAQCDGDCPMPMSPHFRAPLNQNTDDQLEVDPRLRPLVAAADELADAFCWFDSSGCQQSVSRLYAAVLAYREARAAFLAQGE
jgi:hypothetical protein